MSNQAIEAFGRRRGRPPNSNFELYSWFFMRISGVILLGLAVFHLFWMHAVIGVDQIDFDVVAQRWTNPLWRLYDLFLLAFALTHGMNGLRIIVDDYVHKAGWLTAVKAVLFVIFAAFLGMGAYIIVTFTPVASTPAAAL
ncbi:MAG TPA: succinate dehydrogenase hydrophobic membrane anchor subunit [Longimicrobiales bacterium]